jgi:hypothetical protein
MNNDDLEDLMLVRDIYSTQPAKECASALKVNELRVICETFYKNMEDVYDMMLLPHKVAWIGHFKQQAMLLQVQAITEKGYKDWKTSEVTQQKIRDRVIELQKAKHKELTDSALEEGKVSLRQALSGEDVRSSIRSLLRLSISAFWTAFECLTKDAWIYLVNSRPKDVVSRVLHAVVSEGEPDGISEKQISLRLLAKYEFDLRGSLGSVLVEKFDFTSVAGIRKAYAALFGKPAELEEIFTNESLTRLEAVRHVIVHRAGIADDEYIKRLRIPLSKGEMVPIDAETTEKFGNVVIGSGCALLRFVDSKIECLHK